MTDHKRQWTALRDVVVSGVPIPSSTTFTASEESIGPAAIAQGWVVRADAKKAAK